ncbi:MAG: DnaA regulatory inactivator Hda [Sedimenticola sp.]|nr:DnaA regulatory inactivator Hda [Sedimenticola sp.]
MAKQLALQFVLPEKAAIESYVSRANAQAVSALRASAGGNGEPYLYLWGAAGTGKSHLLQAATRLTEEAGRSAVYIPLEQARELAPAIFDDLEQVDLVCLDNVEQIAGDGAWEQALFNLFNRLRDNHRSLLISARCSPLNLPFDLPDLVSRLSWGLCYQLQAMSDRDKAQAMIEDADRRGLQLSEDGARYILRHAPRDMASLRRLLAHMDRAALEAKRRLTTPFIREFLQQQADS